MTTIPAEKPVIKAIDLFCGAGGLTHGLLKSKIPVVAGFDVDPDCKYAYEYNNKIPYIEKDVAELTGEQLKKYYEGANITVLAGCAPCQPFSSYTNNKDERKDWGLVKSFARLIEEVQPTIVTMENVPGLAHHKVYQEFKEVLSRNGYYFDIKERLFCPEYGIPQRRTRFVLLASKLGEIKLISPTHKKGNFKIVKQVIENLEAIKAGEISKKDPLHQAVNLGELNLRRIRSSVPGGSWRNDWSDDLKPDCYKKKTGESYGSVYGRMRWDEPAPTMTTQCFGYGNGRFGHPSQDRAISLREAALFQTFPKGYRFTKPKEKINISKVGRMIGNAVPVDLGKVVGKSIVKHLSQFRLEECNYDWSSRENS